ncbi:hypothetical protein DMUE_2741 [Dictyocoela muelleri]|nr:hypothetical protein DMUE_2741 [Dictyocoela muelleri]
MNSLLKQSIKKNSRETVFQHKTKKLNIFLEVRLKHLEDTDEQDTLAWVANTKYIFDKIRFTEDEKWEILGFILHSKIAENVKKESLENLREYSKNKHLSYILSTYMKKLNKISK